MEPRSHFHFLIRKYGRWRSLHVLKKIEESQIKFLLRCEDGGSCSRGRLRGLPDGKVHWKVGNCFVFLIFVIFCTDLAIGGTVEDGA